MAVTSVEEEFDEADEAARLPAQAGCAANNNSQPATDFSPTRGSAGRSA